MLFIPVDETLVLHTAARFNSNETEYIMDNGEKPRNVLYFEKTLLKNMKATMKLKKDHNVDTAKEEEELIDECDEIRKQDEGVGLSDVLVEIVRYAYHKGKQST